MPQTTREKVYRFIVAYKRAHDGCAPALQEIADSVYTGKSVVHHHLRRLESDGLVTVLGTRSIIVRGGSWEYVDSTCKADFALTRDRGE